jgi:uncharacterized protein YfiM (DUF2279 family)
MVAAACLLVLPLCAAAQSPVRARAAVGARPGSEEPRSAASTPTATVQERGNEADPWFGPDKVKHFFTSAALQSLAYGAARAADVEHDAALASASVLTLAFGVGKEFSDRRRGRVFSGRDLVWDVAGAAAISLLLAQTER